jgi:hypothetical protein
MPLSNSQISAHSDITSAGQEVRLPLKIAAIGLRSLFLIVLVTMVVHVSLPQNESIWRVYNTPADLVRLAVGFLVSAWIVYHLFVLPKDAQGYRTWGYLGIVLVPMALAALYAVW